MKTLRKDGYAITVEGTWYEVSDGEKVIAYGNCADGTEPLYIYNQFSKGNA